MKIKIKVNFEFELNRAWIDDEETEEPIGEVNYVVPANWLSDMFDKFYVDKYTSLDDFLSCYVPEEDGEFIYQQAIKDGCLIEDFGPRMYEEK